MRIAIDKLLVLSVLTCCILFVLACRQKVERNFEWTEEEPPRLASIVHVADPRANGQLLAGFHSVEHNAWRWTKGKFSVMLRPPASGALKGANLQVRLTVPEPALQKVKSIRLSSEVAGTPLPPETFSKPGEYTYSRSVPASLLDTDSVKVDFALDKSFTAGGGDERELGIIVRTIGFEAK